MTISVANPSILPHVDRARIYFEVGNLYLFFFFLFFLPERTYNLAKQYSARFHAITSRKRSDSRWKRRTEWILENQWRRWSNEQIAELFLIISSNVLLQPSLKRIFSLGNSMTLHHWSRYNCKDLSINNRLTD